RSPSRWTAARYAASSKARRRSSAGASRRKPRRAREDPDMLGRVEQKYIVAMVGVFSIFMELLDMTIVNVAVPTLQREFHVISPSTIQWVVTGYLLSLAVFIPISGWAGDRFGTKRVFMFAVSVFALASLSC